MKKILTILLSLVMLMSLSGFAPADKKYQEYLDYVDAGWIKSDITYEIWQEMVEQSMTLEEILENSEDFVLVYDSSDVGTYGVAPIYSMEKGDIFVTNGTSSAGILGHAGIAISASNILHIAGFGENPDIISLNQWNSAYTDTDTDHWTKVYRHYSSSTATEAGDWAYDTYAYTDVEYALSLDLSSTNETYCSKIVWQAYYYGPSSPAATGSLSGYVLPYDLVDRISNISQIYTYE